MKSFRWITILLVLITSNTTPTFSLENGIVYVSGKSCNHGVNKLVNSPYALLTFCEGALGNYLAIIYIDKMLAPVDGAWHLNDRYWQHDLWGQDVTSYYFDPTKAILFVTTSEIYGSGGIYQLDLRKRSFKTITTVEEKEGRIYQFESIDNEKNSLNYVVTLDGKIEKKSSIALTKKY